MPHESLTDKKPAITFIAQAHHFVERCETAFSYSYHRVGKMSGEKGRQSGIGIECGKIAVIDADHVYFGTEKVKSAGGVQLEYHFEPGSMAVAVNRCMSSSDNAEAISSIASASHIAAS